jgi:opacity protein-like surface antigen
MKAILVGTALAVVFASCAGAAEVKQEPSDPVIKVQKVSDSERDKGWVCIIPPTRGEIRCMPGTGGKRFKR